MGTNPFIVGDEAYEGNWFYAFLKKHKNKVRCYLLNTGGIGELREGPEKMVKRVALRPEIPEMAAIIRGILRDTVDWEKESNFETLIPKEANGLQLMKFNLSNFYEEEVIRDFVLKLQKERIEWLKGFESLDKAIVACGMGLQCQPVDRAVNQCC